MYRNPFVILQGLVKRPGLQIGTVAVVDGNAVRVTLPGGGTVVARGEATVGERVYIRGDIIEGVAANLPIEVIDV
jgi:hypothetical protein